MSEEIMSKCEALEAIKSIPDKELADKTAKYVASLDDDFTDAENSFQTEQMLRDMADQDKLFLEEQLKKVREELKTAHQTIDELLKPSEILVKPNAELEQLREENIVLQNKFDVAQYQLNMSHDHETENFKLRLELKAALTKVLELSSELKYNRDELENILKQKEERMKELRDKINDMEQQGAENASEVTDSDGSDNDDDDDASDDDDDDDDDASDDDDDDDDDDDEDEEEDEDDEEDCANKHDSSLDFLKKPPTQGEVDTLQKIICNQQKEIRILTSENDILHDRLVDEEEAIKKLEATNKLLQKEVNEVKAVSEYQVKLAAILDNKVTLEKAENQELEMKLNEEKNRVNQVLKEWADGSSNYEETIWTLNEDHQKEIHKLSLLLETSESATRVEKEAMELLQKEYYDIIVKMRNEKIKYAKKMEENEEIMMDLKEKMNHLEKTLMENTTEKKNAVALLTSNIEDLIIAKDHAEDCVKASEKKVVELEKELQKMTTRLENMGVEEIETDDEEF